MPDNNEQKISLSESEKIFHAIQHSQYKKLALYIRHRYNLNVIGKDGRNGLFYALDIEDPSKRFRMIQFCLDHRINPLQRDKVNGYTVLNETIARQQMDTFQFFVDEFSGEIDWHSLDKHGRTILHQAVESNNILILTSLIRIMNQYNISVDVLDRHGLTPYLLAVKLHLRDMSEILLKQGRASRQKCDSQTHRSALEWENIGMKENNLHIRKKLRQEIDDAMTKGQINKVNKLKDVYYSTLLSNNERMRRDSYGTTTTRSGLVTKSSLSINEMIDQLSEGDRPESFFNSRKAEHTFHMEHILPTSLPPITNLRKPPPNSSFNSLIDLFQIAQLSS